MNIKLFKSILVVILMVSASAVFAENAAEQKIKKDIQKQLGDRVKVQSVRATPMAGLFEVAIGGDIVYTDGTARYLIQGEVIDLKTGLNLTEQRSDDLNRISWSDLPLVDSIKVVKGNGSRQLAVFADPNCGYCKRLEKSFQELNNVTIYTFLIPILSKDSMTVSQKIWCSSDKGKAWTEWMVSAVPPSGSTDCATPLDKNLSMAKKYSITGTPAIFFPDGSRIAGAVPLAQIEKKLK